ncbi:MAG: 4-alpha-glucanotransferase [Oscillospiraceae bacterium]
MRSSGILLPISSLPCPYGIGSLGKGAYDFVDFLHKAKQRYWQILPIGPTGYGDSPYQSFSAFASNPYFIDLDILYTEGLLTKDERDSAIYGDDDVRVNYGRLFTTRNALLAKAAARFDTSSNEYKEFCNANSDWLDDYSLFMALKAENNMVSFTLWDDDIRTRDENALNNARLRCKDEMRTICVLQYLFSVQWKRLISYAHENDISIIGDIPIYVSPDSSELWAHSEMFCVNEKGEMTYVAGCPPDGFSASGQLWGNPLYNWQYHKDTHYAWWLRRMQYASSVYDVVRIDHFRGFEGYYAIKADAKDAKHGEWIQGPSKDFIGALKTALPNLNIIAEDLGFLTDGVRELLDFSGYPGMKVLQFAFDSREDSDYLPHNYVRNSIVYTGTHDNTTTEDWQKTAPHGDVRFARRYLGTAAGSLTPAFIRAALMSVSDTAIIMLQDYLQLGKSARINTPSTLGGNWVWRVSQNVLTDVLALQISKITKLYGR